MTPAELTALYLPHGGGPLPLLGDPRHAGLVSFFNDMRDALPRPDVIVMVSAHWEAEVATLSSAARPAMIYDYYGFPEPAYHYQYAAPGAPELATRLIASLTSAGIAAGSDDARGFDHGTFVPLMLMYPDADIPVVQLSLLASLDPAALIDIGRAIAGADCGRVLLLGSGMSFHNMAGFMSGDPAVHGRSVVFDQWLNDVVAGRGLTAAQREEQLVQWSAAPEARFCHPREEHLLPLHVCYGAADALGLKARNAFRQDLLGVQVSAFLWQACGN